ncbi:MAG: hypothetical protein JXA69_07485 [Phycisphaerae bacterium]|nr:hypothetical protein [Phycisphaerae bacterium]
MKRNADHTRFNASSVPVVTLAIVSLWLAAGCTSGPDFSKPMDIRHADAETIVTFDMDGDGCADYWQYQESNGRKRALAYTIPLVGTTGERIELDDVDPASCPHFLIALDGVPFDVVDRLYREGRFRLFYPPRRLICCFPSMTDLALAQLFHAGPCLAYETLYYDRAAGRMSDGNSVYLNALNSPWLPKVDYRCSYWWDAKAYLDPKAVFNHELRGITKTFEAVEAGEAAGYSVGTAGLGTRGGRDAIREYLIEIDQLCEQIVWQRRGRVKLTLVADHGHNLTECKRVSLKAPLTNAGYRVTKSLREPRDVVVVEYGLVTYAALYTDDATGVAACLLGLPEVELAFYRADDSVVVRDAGGEAGITKRDGGYTYDVRSGDPLQLAPIIAGLQKNHKVTADGTIDDTAMFAATAEHVYPDPLARIWGAFHDVATMPPDVVVTLRDGACHGSKFFHVMIGTVKSTHGSLNRINSTTIAMTMLGELPEVMRSTDVKSALDRLRGSR